MKTRMRIFAMLILVAFALAACGPQAQTAQPAEPTRTPGPTLPPVEVSRAAESTATPALPKSKFPLKWYLLQYAGEVKRYQLDSELMNGELYVSVYFPPCYDEAARTGLPGAVSACTGRLSMTRCGWI